MTPRQFCDKYWISGAMGLTAMVFGVAAENRFWNCPATFAVGAFLLTGCTLVSIVALSIDFD